MGRWRTGSAAGRQSRPPPSSFVVACRTVPLALLCLASLLCVPLRRFSCRCWRACFAGRRLICRPSSPLPLSVAGGHCAACARQRASLFPASFSVLCSCSSVRLSGRRRKKEGELSPLAFRFYLFPSPLLREHCEDCAVAAAVLVGSVPIPQLPVFICNGQGSVSYFSVLCDSSHSLHCALFVGFPNPQLPAFPRFLFFLLRFSLPIITISVHVAPLSFLSVGASLVLLSSPLSHRCRFLSPLSPSPRPPPLSDFPRTGGNPGKWMLSPLLTREIL